jgi:WD40 repeat protein
MAFSRNGTVLAAPGGDNVATLWDLHTRRVSAAPGRRGSPVRAVAFSAGGTFFASASDDVDGDVDLRDTLTLHVVGRFPPVHAGPVSAVALSPRPTDLSATTVATGGDDGVIAISDLGNDPPQILHGYRAGVPIEAVAFSRDGKMLASGSEDGSVMLWDLQARGSAGTRYPLQTPVGPARPVVAVSFSRDGRMLASASTDGVVSLWDVARGSLSARLAGRPGTTSVTFDPGGDGRMLATADQDGTPVLWDTDAYQVRKRLCGGLRPVLNPSEWSAHVPGEPYRQVCR